MAPPIPHPAQPPMIRRRRSPADLFFGLLAVAVLAALTIGVPCALVRVFGLPIPHTLPKLSTLTHQLDVTTILKVLSVLVWLAWLQLVWCVIAEVRVAVRYGARPARVARASGTPAVVDPLLFAATTALSPAWVHQVSGAVPVSAGREPGPVSGSQPAGSRGGLPPQLASPPRLAHPPTAAHSPPATHAPKVHGSPAHPPRADKIYVVQPPHGRFHESLWEIAQRFLGDGRRYREIFALNAGRIQPDGSKLTIASLIRPGWVLHMPRDAHGPGIAMVTPSARHSADQDRAGQNQAPGRDALLDSEPGRHAAHGVASHAHAGDRSAAARHEPRPGYPNELAAASLLATGVLAALGRYRREQLWQRAFGRRVVAPEREAALAESTMPPGAHEPSVDLLDGGLRYLSHTLAVAGRIPPTVFAAHLSPENLDLWIAPADLDPPEPWTAVGDGQLWRLPFAALTQVDVDEASGAPALLPGLVPIGTDDAGRVLVDLEAAHGLIAVTGPQQLVTAVLSSMAMELATNRWSDQMHLTLVGFGELTDLAPDRATAVRTLDEALPALEAWVPHCLISAVPPTTAQRTRLLALAEVRHAAGYVVAGDASGASWTWEVTAEGRLLAGALGLDVEAQLLPAQQQEAGFGRLDAAAQYEGVALPAPPAGAAPSEQLDPGNVMPVEITILGPTSVQAPGMVEPEWAGLVTEVVVYLAAHPGAVRLDDLTAAIWPRGVTTETRDAALDRARDWLGMDNIGRAHLAVDAGGRLRLGSGVRVDWQVLRALVGHAALAPPGTHGEAGYLARALELVQGPLLDGRDPRHYAWLAADGLEYEVTARVADAAHRLATLRLTDGNAWGAMDAARAGLQLAFGDELLWRDLLHSVHTTGQDDVIRAVMAELSARVALDEVLPWMAPETVALIDGIYPSWRSAVG